MDYFVNYHIFKPSYRGPYFIHLFGWGGDAPQPNPYSCVSTGARIWIFRGAPLVWVNEY